MVNFSKVEQSIKRLRERLKRILGSPNNISYGRIGYKKGKDFSDVVLEPFTDGMRWGGGRDRHYLFRFSLKTPVLSENERFEISFLTDKDKLCNPQFIVYGNGEALQGIDNEHKHVVLQGDKEYDIEVYAYSGALIDESYSFEPILSIVNRDVERLIYDLEYPLEWLKAERSGSEEYYKTYGVLSNVCDKLELYADDKAFMRSILTASKFIEENFYQASAGYFQNSAEIFCVGHSHIDVAWLWTLAIGAEKAQHTAASMLRLMEEYPEFRYISSQPLLYSFVKQEDPKLYAQIKDFVKRGQWEPEGAMWVESDCNLPSGESLVRQLVYGKRFFKEEFGVESHIAWLPDAFGFSAALPQILLKSGVDTFVTSKLSWGETNSMPNDLFLWEGVDGSKILTYFITAQDLPEREEWMNKTVYSGKITLSQVRGTYKRFRNKDVFNGSMIPFGFGDGGGGATRDYMEMIRRMRRSLPDVPTVTCSSANEFFQKLHNAAKNSELKEWFGELYLEFHRGVFTTQAKTKRNNRLAEFLLQNAEKLSVSLDYLKNADYPSGLLRKNWEKLLTNQFHDILPGSSIGEVYQKTAQDYKEIFESVGSLVENSMKEIAKSVSGEGVCLFNFSSYAGAWETEHNGNYVLFENLPQNGYMVVKPIALTDTETIVSTTHLENKWLKVEFDKFGNIFSVYDKKAQRQLVKAGRLFNEICAYEDDPIEFDAWEIKDYVYDKRKEVRLDEVKVIERSGRKFLRIVRKIGDSMIEQTISLRESMPFIDVETVVDWKEEHTLLKVFFPFDIHTKQGTFDSQFSYIKRDLHANTSWDASKYEVCGHKFYDLSEVDYGVAVMNDGKYGYGIKNGEINMSLLRSSTYPDPTADRGKHCFRYAIYPHIGEFESSDVQRVAYLYNNPPSMIELNNGSGSMPKRFSFVESDNGNVVIDTIKKSEEENAYVCRLYCSKNMHTEAELKFAFDFTKVYFCDLLEREQKAVMSKGNTVRLQVKPFELVTLKIKFDDIIKQ